MLSIPVSPSPAQMSRRPLTNVSHNIPSPYGGNASTTSGKRISRPKEDIYGQPPAKVQRTDADFQKSRDLSSKLAKTPSKPTSLSQFRRDAPSGPSGKLKLRVPKGEAPPPFALDKATTRRVNGLKISKDNHQAQTKAVVTQQDAEATERIANWQRHFRKAFKSMVFYFDTVSDPSDQLLAILGHFGSVIEPVFSSRITHVIAASADTPVPKTKAPEVSNQPKTINPTLLDKFQATQDKKRMPGRDRLNLDDVRSLGKRKDILTLAREQEMKIWTLEKLERMLNTLLEGEDEPVIVVQTKKKPAQVQATRVDDDGAEALEFILRNEKLNGPTDRDPNAVSKEMIYMKGPYILCKDMTNIHRPFMVREYAKVTFKEDGEWPQFRATKTGRCPFVEDVRDKAERLEEREREQATKLAKEQENIFAHKPVVKAQIGKMDPPSRPQSTKQLTDAQLQEKKALASFEVFRERHLAEKAAKENAAKSNLSSKLFQATKVGAALINATTTDNSFPPKQQEHYKDRHGHQQQRAVSNYEPLASGMQSSITSTICSNTISSNPAGSNGARAGTSKDLHSLQRKILERKNINVVGNGPAAQRNPKVVGVPADFPFVDPRPKVVGIPTDFQFVDPRPVVARGSSFTKAAVAPVEVKSKKAAAPGYCENCRVKFDDFDSHCISKRHRKFALDNRNFDELDELLVELVRPRKDYMILSDY